MDDTLTAHGRLSALTYQALERLGAAGFRVIPVTAAPAGWCDQMARMWPIEGVIGENGGFFFRRDGERAVRRTFWSGEGRAAIGRRLEEVRDGVMRMVRDAVPADDQWFRLTSLAFDRPDAAEERDAIAAALRDQGAAVTQNNLWVLGWLGGYDKLAMARRILADVYGIDVEKHQDAIAYVGDSANDAPMFAFFRHTVGVSSVRRHLADIPKPPAWITRGGGGDGFVEFAELLLSTPAEDSPGRRSPANHGR
jgi:hypothetical protein